MIVAKLSMVSFFKTPAPERYVEKQITLERRTEVPFVAGSLEARSAEDAEGKDGAVGEKVLWLDEGKALLKEGSSGYLFSGQIEIRRVDCAPSQDGVLTEGLEVVIKKYTGEWVGTIVYDYVYCGGKKCYDMAHRKLVKTVHHLEDEQYHVYVNYEADRKIVLRMEVCPGDEEVLQRCLQDYEAEVVFTPCKG